MKDILKNSLTKAISYEDYRSLVEKLVQKASTTGKEKTEALAEYTKLNDRRMRRWDKTLKAPELVLRQAKNHNESVTWLVITESWCGDAAHLIPVMNKVAQLNSNITLKLVMRDENDKLMDKFLTNGSRSIPKLIAIDQSNNNVLATYGPRPSTLTKMVVDHKAEHGKLLDEFKEEIQRWYNKDKGQTTFEDLSKLLDKVPV